MPRLPVLNERRPSAGPQGRARLLVVTQERRSSDAKLPIPDLPMSGTSGTHSAPTSEPFALPDKEQVPGELLGLDLDLPMPDEFGLGLDLELPPPEPDVEDAVSDSQPRAPSLEPSARVSGTRPLPHTVPKARGAATPARGVAAQGVRAPEPAAAHDELDGDLDDLDNMDALDRSNMGFATDAPQAQGVRGPERRTTPWPTGRTPHGDALVIDEIEVRLASGFGKVPDNLLYEPLYTWKVFSGRRRLLAQLTSEKAKIVDAEAMRDKLLIQFVESARSMLEKDKRLDRVLEKVKRVESKAKTRSGKLTAVGEKYQKDIGALDTEGAELRRGLAQAQSLLEKIERELAPRAEAFKRAEAKHKRVQIEIRNLRVADERAKIADMERARAAAEPALGSSRAAVQETESAMRGVQASLRELDTKLGSVRQRATAVEAAYAEQFDTRTQGLSDDAKEHLLLLADAGRTLLECHALCDFESPLIERIRASDEVVLERVTAHETLLRATTSHDEEAFRRGTIIAGVVGGVVFLLLLLWVLSPGTPSGNFDDEQYESHVVPGAGRDAADRAT
jgi:hypothetical protein